MPKSKSAYSVPTKKEKSDTYIFVVWVDNEAGVLARVVGLFSGRCLVISGSFCNNFIVILGSSWGYFAFIWIHRSSATLNSKPFIHQSSAADDAASRRRQADEL